MARRAGRETSRSLKRRKPKSAGKDLLNKLPAELRNRIWEEVLPNEWINPLRARFVLMRGSFGHRRPMRMVMDDEEHAGVPAPALLKVNKAIRSDARPMSIAATTFVFDFFAPGDIQAFSKWWSALGQDAKCVREMRFDGIRQVDDGGFVRRQLVTQEVMFGVDEDTHSVSVVGVVRGRSDLFGEEERWWSSTLAVDARILQSGLSIALSDTTQHTFCDRVEAAVRGFFTSERYDLSHIDGPWAKAADDHAGTSSDNDSPSAA